MTTPGTAHGVCVGVNVVERSSMAPRFLITIDTEGDNLWSRPRQITTRNANFLPRFQALCERYGLKPTYLTSYEMAESVAFREFGRDVIRRSAAEIGMHLHAWNSPPLTPLTTNDYRYQPYLIEYPETIMRQKVGYLTEFLENVFDVKMRSHRAGRWSINEVYARILAEKGYLVDCSVTPHVSWMQTQGGLQGSGGTDYSNFPELPYFMNLEDISKVGDSPLLEIPVTIVKEKNLLLGKIRSTLAEGSLPQRVLDRLFPPRRWLRPNGRNGRDMIIVLNKAREERRDCVEFMLHSSELMPGGSPRFPRNEDIEALYDDLEALFSYAGQMFKGSTLLEYYQDLCERSKCSEAQMTGEEAVRTL